MHNNYKKNLLLVGLCVSTILFGVKPVKADASPPPTVPGSDVAAGQTTKVRMAEELVVFDLTKLDRRYDNRFPVTATFTMVNDGQTDEEMKVRFPMGCEVFDFSKISDFKAEVDGFSLPVDYVEGEPVFLPMSPGLILNPQFCQTIRYAQFPVIFPSHKKTILNISYVLQARPSGARASFGYYLETGRGWNGVIGEGTIKVIYPFPTSYENIKVKWEATNSFWPEYKGNEAIWRFANLEPTSKNNLIFETIFPYYWQHVVDAKKAIAESPKNPSAYIQMGDAYAHVSADFHGSVNNYFVERSINAYNKALYFDRFLPEAHAGIAKILFRQNWLKFLGDENNGMFSNPILKHLSIALAIDPTNLTALDTWDRLNCTKNHVLPTVNPMFIPSPSPTLASILTTTPEP